jgi:LysR family transcriptional regulator, glycine cleavage system transcriptional activator
MTHAQASVARQLRQLSLDALRGYESAARLQSFTLAADELSLTQSAISKQIRSIEEVLGCQLFVRGSRKLRLTQEGRVVLQGVQQAIHALNTSIGSLATEGKETVVLTAWPSFVSMWLMPRLNRLRAAAPDINLVIDSSETMTSPERDGYDLAVRLPSDPLTSPLARRLGTEEAFLVASPQLAPCVREPRDLLQQTLLIYGDARQRFPWMAWSEWFDRLGLRQPMGLRSLQFSQYDHAIGAAVHGCGIAIGRTPSVLSSLASGQLRPVLPEHRIAGLHYYLLMSENAADKPSARQVADWIESELQAPAHIDA